MNRSTTRNNSIPVSNLEEETPEPITIFRTSHPDAEIPGITTFSYTISTPTGRTYSSLPITDALPLLAYLADAGHYLDPSSNSAEIYRQMRGLHKPAVQLTRKGTPYKRQKSSTALPMKGQPNWTIIIDGEKTTLTGTRKHLRKHLRNLGLTIQSANVEEHTITF